MVRKLVQINVIRSLGQEGLQILEMKSYILSLTSEYLTDLDQACEGWSLTGIFIPAVEHHVVNFSVAVLGLIQPLTLPDLLHDLTARHAGVGSGAQGHDLPHQHAV